MLGLQTWPPHLLSSYSLSLTFLIYKIRMRVALVPQLGAKVWGGKRAVFTEAETVRKLSADKADLCYLQPTG